MRIQRARVLKFLMVLALSGLVASSSVLAQTPPSEIHSDLDNFDLKVVLGPLVLPRFNQASDEKVFKLSDEIAAQRERVREALLSQLKMKSLSAVARAEAVTLLVELKPDQEVITALIENINVVPNVRASDGFTPRPRTAGFIARKALATAGKPAEKAILALIGARYPKGTNNEQPLPIKGREKFTQAEGFAGVLTRINGRVNAVTKLRELQHTTRNSVVKQQFQEVIDWVKKGERSPVEY